MKNKTENINWKSEEINNNIKYLEKPENLSYIAKEKIEFYYSQLTEKQIEDCCNIFDGHFTTWMSEKNFNFHLVKKA
jgi:hypothetical protein